jgi:pilus assembly protein FimV
MTRKLVPILVALALGCPQAVSALALGDLRVRSALNEPLDAEIDLLSIRGEDLADLRAKLATTEEFQRAGVDRPYVLSRLRFKVEERSGGKAVLKVSTRQPVKEPFLNFLLELNWPQGRLVREYTALLDPPVYGAAAAARVQGPLVKAQPEPLPPPIEVPAVEAPVVADAAAPSVPPSALEVPPPLAPSAPRPIPAEPEPRASAPAPQPGPAPRPAAAPAPAAPSAPAAEAAADGYGPTRAGDTLWSIANRVRPDASVSTQQMMVALLRANPDAFAMGNVNALKTGYVLKVPDRQAIDAVAQNEAMADLRRQQTAWEDYRQGTARSARPAPLAAAPTPAAAPAEPARKPGAEPVPAPVAAPPASRLEIVAAGTAEGAGTRKGQGAAALKKELTVLQEDLDGRRQEIAELQSRLAEAEALIQDLQRLIKLKDETLSALQQQALVAQARAEEPAPPVVEPAPAPVSAVSLAVETPPTQPPVPVTDVLAPPAPAVAAPPAPLAEVAAVAPPASEAVAPAPAPAAVPLPAEPVTLAELDGGQARSLLDSLTANPTVFWGGLAGLLAIVGGLLSVRRRRPGEESPAPAALVPEEPSTAVVAAVPSVSTVPEPSAAEPVSAPRPVEPRTEDSRAEDPMAEVNVYLAYERFAQAEELVREAIAAHPDRPEYRLKLLEIHHAAKNPAAFERDAGALREVAGDGSPLLERARAWWADLSPGRTLFAPVALAVGTAAAAAAGPELERTLRLSAEDIRSALDLGPEDSVPTGEEGAEDLQIPSGDVDFDLGLKGAEEPSSESVDFDLELGAATPIAAQAESAPSEVDLPVLEAADGAIASALAEATEALDLDLGQDAEATPAEPASGSLDFELEAPGPVSAGDRPEPVSQGDSVDLSLEPMSVSSGTTPLAAGLSSAVAESASPVAEASGLDLEPMALEPLDPANAPAAPTGPASFWSEPASVGEATLGSVEAPGVDLTLEPLEGLPRASEGVPDEVLQTLTPKDAAAPEGSAGRLAARAAEDSPDVEFELDLDLSSGEPDEASFFLDGDGMGSLDEVGTKLDLARAYIDMGDTEGARGILGEVLSEGNDTQQGEARELLSRLAS